MKRISFLGNIRWPGRQFWVMAHRWAGLTIAGFLAVAGITGSVLPFKDELTIATRPSVSDVRVPFPGALPLSPEALALKVEAQTGAQVSFLPLQTPTDHVIEINVFSPDEARPLNYDTVWVNPFDGSIRSRFRYGVLADGYQNLVPFLYHLHYGFVLGDWGVLAFGLAALIWTFDCFVGFYLTLPIPAKSLKSRANSGKSWLERWRPAWSIRRNGAGHKLTFDIHRASGLWLWPLLLVFAWSAIGFNLPAVHGHVMKVFGSAGYVNPPGEPVGRPKMNYGRARAAGAALMEEQARKEGFAVYQEGWMGYDETTGNYFYSVRSSLDRSHEDADTFLWFSADDGTFVRLDRPMGAGSADAFTAWLNMLHMAKVFGLPYRIFVSVLGIAVTILSVTGILIWTKKRSAKLLAARRRRLPDRTE